MGEYRKLWWTLIAVLVVTFGVLGVSGVEIYRKAPPIPAEVVSASGELLMTRDDILAGQAAWQSTGGMQLGSIWGHGAYQAPDWSADWLHRELTAWLTIAARETYGAAFDTLAIEQKAALTHRLKEEYRRNSHDAATGVVTVSDRRAQAMAQTADHYARLYGDDPALRPMRDNYAMKESTLPDPAKRAVLTDFFFWTAWAASTERPGTVATYTNNWPPEPLIGNHPTPENILWSLACVVILVAGVGALIWGWAFLRRHDDTPLVVAEKDPLTLAALTPSQRALGKYLFVVLALFIFQVFIGGFTAHYTIEGQSFYGFDVSQWFPYALSRTWHVQSAVMWIATAFLAAGLFLAPVIHGSDPKYQKLGVDILFWALILVVAGSFIGNYLALSHALPDKLSFWLGHQGYEYLDLGRLWQIALFGGLLFWLTLMLRAMLPALRRGQGDRNLLALLTLSTIAIGLFYGSGLFYGERTHITIMEYWRWWVVHLWVEGIFEVFATAAIAFIFASMGLVSKRIATAASLASASLFMVGGVPGTFHHLYFSGTTTPILAVGAAFSALEVVPLIVLGYEAWEHWSLRDRAPWMRPLRWPLMCFIAVAFWNMLGAGVFGFMINTPLALFYLQGLNTTAVHAHAALFGVYGFLALGFTLLVLRYIRPEIAFNERLMRVGFWGLNAGLVLMIFTSLLPVGLYQFEASVTTGMWYARSDAFLQQGFLETLRWIRTFGDVVFIIGAIAIAWQVVILGLWRKGARA
ncbi:nitric-oxide reductase large subunit [Sphingopyxis sp. SCN 67-31]|uniref:nitric-oxide reductase large subunit n=1 Tax=Sphingopyxis sp. SCN 67-31 TaxID=1660142 RepID=UPI00086D1DBD|nr:nitric-oxide reductase large subunit [Sphingopyxis sp. SCN 67-31]ODU25805.1 MAG: nitric oxide reductase large subunit [Sphingopyxis sp. SCN 67-31]